MSLERIREIVAECDSTSEEAIESAINELRPFLTPYFEEGEYEDRFADQFRKTMQLPLPTKHLMIVEAIKGILSGPTYAEGQKKAEEAAAEREAAMQAQWDVAEHAFVSSLLARIGFRKGDRIAVRHGPDTVRVIDLSAWELPELETDFDENEDEGDA